MSRIAEVLSVERVHDDTGHGVDVKLDAGDDDATTAPHFSTPGDDSLPLPGDFAALEESGGYGAEQAVGYADVKNAGVAAPGEVRRYARSSSGAIVAQVFLRGDGTITVSNASGSVEIAPGGAVTINGVVIGTDGSITAPGSVTASGDVIAKSGPSQVGLSTHLHPTGIGPTSAPTPGT